MTKIDAPTERGNSEAAINFAVRRKRLLLSLNYAPETSDAIMEIPRLYHSIVGFREPGPYAMGGAIGRLKQPPRRSPPRRAA